LWKIAYELEYHYEYIDGGDADRANLNKPRWSCADNNAQFESFDADGNFDPPLDPNNASFNPLCNFKAFNFNLGKIGHNIWFEFEQDCDDMITNGREHFDWFVFKQPIEKLAPAFIDTFPEDAVYFGPHMKGRYSILG